MIGTLSGTVEEVVCSNRIILCVGGVGYLVQLPGRVLSGCQHGDHVRLYIETYVGRDGVSQLYGFANREEQNCMRMLIKVSGVNYKTAMAILDVLTPDQVFSAIVNEDKAALKVGGVGEKLISRIISELTPQVQKFELNRFAATTRTDSEAVAALLSLGYERTAALGALQKVGVCDSTEDAVRRALLELSK
ncbi:Holliday junction branch migration protein RuvA [Anaplasma marginale]|uniref:Holliday junction branch migration protein RuvA n=1 Tax=Anaplasma marginale TaxID=770 RepID=UPI00123A63C1|nr:Holliday junction branch migration protein RuvA [Anaplasma marginale]KAA8472250.1 Holliday junction branch migration protein RuvA [Anaplasma marginale]KAB0450565.1 Holliday junction branch migration protein RuvA [Anaplasma marginale]KAB0451811.1 Holliday junction branch migration protein RuvA [Anaplasma marginale]